MSESTPPIAVERERLNLLFGQARATSVGAAVAATVCAIIIHHAIPGPGPWIWLSAILVITVARLAFYQRFFATEPGSIPTQTWLRWHACAAVPIGIAAGALPLLHLHDAPLYIQELEALVPALVTMAAITSFGVYFSQYMVLLLTTMLTTIVTRLWADGSEGVPIAIMFALFAPLLALTAKRYANSILRTLDEKHRSQQLVEQLTSTNYELEQQNNLLANQRDMIAQEEELAMHVFKQLTLGGNDKVIGVHAWNQSMGALSGDLIHTARGPKGQVYIFLADFTGHGLPAALGALPASLVFLAMAGKGLPIETIAAELNRKLHQLLPVGYFCCAVLLELSADRCGIRAWNGGLPPILVRRRDRLEYERIASHSVPLGVVGEDDFETKTVEIQLRTGDLLYAYSDGLTEAENRHGEMWGRERLENFLKRDDLPTPRIRALINAVMEHVNLAPASDDISVVEIEATPESKPAANAA